MPRTKFQTLTEQMFYILLCLKNECYGLDILDRVPAMTKGRVTVGSGTLYNLLEQFLQEGDLACLCPCWHIWHPHKSIGHYPLLCNKNPAFFIGIGAIGAFSNGNVQFYAGCGVPSLGIISSVEST